MQGTFQLLKQKWVFLTLSKIPINNSLPLGFMLVSKYLNTLFQVKYDVEKKALTKTGHKQFKTQKM